MLIEMWEESGNGMRSFILLLMMALIGMWGYCLFHIAAWSFAAKADISIQILLFLTGVAAHTVLSALSLSILTPAIIAAGLLWCAVWAVIEYLIKFIINRCRSLAWTERALPYKTPEN